MALREVLDLFYAVNAIRKTQHIKSSSSAKVYQYLKKLDKNLEEAHFETLESFVKNGYFAVQGEAEEESIFFS